MTANRASPADPERLKEQVRSRYAAISSRGGCCGSSAASCCEAEGCSTQLGYGAEELADLPPGADLGLGCGNPTALLSLRSGEVVLDLGSGAGIDCFLASRRVGPCGRVIGVDMTPEMVAKARANARSGGYPNVEFRLGEIEHLPVPDRSVDVVLSNCVINLVPDKGAVYREAFRVLRRGGRLAISDVVATRALTASERADPSLWSSCSSGAIEVPELKRRIRRAGFTGVSVDLASSLGAAASLTGPASLGVVPAHIRATKPPG